MLLPSCICIRHSLLLSNLQALFVASLLKYHHPEVLTIYVRLFLPLSNIQCVDTTGRRPIEVWLICIHVAI